MTGSGPAAWGGGWRVALLLAMAVLTGLVDATSFLSLGHVFVANMTGNVVFLAFALGGAPGLSADLSALALVCFLAGTGLAGRIGTAAALAGRRWLVVALAAQVTLIAGALAAAAVTGGGDDRPYAVVAPLAVAMGLQHATGRRVAVPEVPTNVLTTTLTGLVVDSRLAGGPGYGDPRRFAAPVAMFSGALVGATCLLHVNRLVPLAAATALAAGCLIGAVTGLCAGGTQAPPQQERRLDGR
ncbi:conserved membrane hypothetical protein [Frankia canadensis]|uniref:DUF1275 domain-containing protein n=1 Tax=Frankia canadensis TaxID=1836972 RepID=A0A2I2KXT2_9ACTN|nr:YoaK family protein [Frankia canadensis]SNQ50472.1 conserved membrane hypothetical protein [Frankia canadensis]SOU57762.1 conserved membrane hypothetical protein [Frankia canadensis]